VNTLKRKWIIPAVIMALVLLGTLAWQLISRHMTEQVEVKVQQALQQLDLQDKTQWEKLSVSPLGALTFNNLRIELSQDETLKVGQVRISDFIDQADHQRIRVQLKQANPELSPMVLKGVPEASLNPIDINLHLDLNFANDQAKILYESQQKDSADIELQLHLSQIGALRGLLGTIFPQSAAASADLDPNFIGLNRLAAAFSISLNAFDGKIKNHGLINAIKKDMNKETGDTGEQAFVRDIQEKQSVCHGGVDKLKQPCQNLADFVLGKKNSLHLTAKPAQPVSLEQLNDVMNGKTEPLFKLLNINIQ